MSEHVKFISYTGKFPCLCMGQLTLEIDGKTVTFGDGGDHYSFWSSGGGITADYENYYGKWEIEEDELSEEYRKYAKEIDKVFNENVPYGCCGGCI